MIRRLLAEYGEVISTPLPESTITGLAALADQPRATFLDRYWRHRPAYDLGQAVHEPSSLRSPPSGRTISSKASSYARTAPFS